MVRIRTDNTLRQLRIVGHGITLSDDFELSPGVAIVPSIPPLDPNLAAAGKGSAALHVRVSGSGCGGHPHWRPYR